MAAPDYAHSSDKAFRVVFPMMFAGFAGGAICCWAGDHLVNGIVLTVLAVMALVSLATALREHKTKMKACKVVSAELRQRSVDKVLDIGTGKGLLAIHLAKEGLTATGEDIRAADLEVARQNAAAEGVTVEFIEGDETSLGVSNEAFDAVTSLQLLHEVKEKVPLLKSARACLREGGSLVMVDFRRAPGTFAIMWFGMFKALAAGQLRRLLTEAGFRNVSARPITSQHQLVVGEK